MLSQALEKANTAVLLDNAQNYEGAIKAYDDACRLLHEVLLRSSGLDDKRKLQTIVSECKGLMNWMLSLTHGYSEQRTPIESQNFYPLATQS
jgi:MIT (microtubule interacting and transport) domain